MTDPDPGPVPVRVPVETEQVRRLVAAQFPHWADLAVERVLPGGWDNHTFRLGADLLVRLPSAAAYASAVEKEQRWLPVLAAQVTLPIPVPLGRGEPTAEYPHAWSVYGWLDGAPGSGALLDAPRLAADLGDFLVSLRRVDPTDGPGPGLHNFYRGGPLRTWDAEVRRALAGLEGRLDLGSARDIWEEALAARWDGRVRWFHGDVARGNLLLDGAGRLSGVIDFGTCGVGDPACDLAVAWTLLTPEARPVLRSRLDVDAASWSRGRGWALWKALMSCLRNLDDPEDAPDVVQARAVLAAILAEHAEQ